VDVDGDAWRARVEGFYGQMRRLAGQGEYVASDSTDSYFVLNLSAEYEIANGARVCLPARRTWLTTSTSRRVILPASDPDCRA
jgi:hypothetical protein